MSELEPVLLVEVVAMGVHPDSTTLANMRPLFYGIEVGGVRLPVAYRSRSEALRIAERAYSLLVDGHEERWSIMCERGRSWSAFPAVMRARVGHVQQPVEHEHERIMRERESPGVPVMPGRAEVRRAGQRCLCGHLRSQHSPAREDDFWCLVTGCACSGWHPRR